MKYSFGRKKIGLFLSYLRMISLFIFLLSMIPKQTFSQSLNRCNCCSHYDSITNRYVAEFVEQMPVFPGGIDSMNKFFIKNFYYPEKESNRLQSVVVTAFVIDTCGNIIGQRILGKCKSNITPLEQEGLKVLSLMPKWVPGKCNNKKVPVYIRLRWTIEPQF